MVTFQWIRFEPRKAQEVSGTHTILNQYYIRNGSLNVRNAFWNGLDNHPTTKMVCSIEFILESTKKLLAPTSVLATLLSPVSHPRDTPSSLLVHFASHAFSCFTWVSRKNVLSNTILSVCSSFHYMCMLCFGDRPFGVCFVSLPHTYIGQCSLSRPLQTRGRSSHAESSQKFFNKNSRRKRFATSQCFSHSMTNSERREWEQPFLGHG